MTRAILWDFDCTLATRPGLWSACVVEVLDVHWPGHTVTRADVAPFLESEFPWHDWPTVHGYADDPGGWWDPILALIGRAMIGVGVAAENTAGLADSFRTCFLDPSRWTVYDDSVTALRVAETNGWRNIIVSNHVPELPELVDALGLGDHVHGVLTSALHGYEKPHPGAFHLALEAAGATSDSAWMVGDNPIADIAGAAKIGIRGVLTRVGDFDEAVLERLEANYGASRFPGWQYHCALRAATALEAVDLIMSSQTDLRPSP